MKFGDIQSVTRICTLCCLHTLLLYCRRLVNYLNRIASAIDYSLFQPDTVRNGTVCKYHQTVVWHGDILEFGLDRIRKVQIGRPISVTVQQSKYNMTRDDKFVGI